VADIPDLDKTEFIFVGQVTAVAQPKSTHGKMLQDVSYTRISIKMGLKSNLRDPMTVFHDVTKSPLPTDLVKVGNTLIVGGSGGSEETYVHKADQATLKAIHDALEALVEKLVTAYLKDHDFDITLTQQMGKENQAYLGPDLLSLDEIADRVWSQVRNKVGDASEASIENIRKYVDQYYRQSVEEWKKSGSSQVLVQLGQAPAIPFWASRAQPPGSNRQER
jgi:hypothetical protein